MKITILKYTDILCQRTWHCGDGCCSESEIEWTSFNPTTLNVSPYCLAPKSRLEIYEDDMPEYITRDYTSPFIINLDDVEEQLEEGNIEITDELREWLNENNNS